METPRIRLGKINPAFLTDMENQNPYSTHEAVDLQVVMDRLFRLSDRMFLHANQKYTLADRDTLVFDLKSLYLYQSASSNFKWYLNTLEFSDAGKNNYKFMGIADIDIGPNDPINIYYQAVVMEMEMKRKEGMDCQAWFTGKKGFRLVAFPTGSLFAKKQPDAFFLSPLWKKPNNGGEVDPARIKLCLKLLEEKLDPSIYVSGHGVKFDLMHHPQACRLPVFLTGERELDMAKINGTVPTDTSELGKIGMFWLGLFTKLKLILSNPGECLDTTFIPVVYKDRTTIAPPCRGLFRTPESSMLGASEVFHGQATITDYDSQDKLISEFSNGKLSLSFVRGVMTSSGFLAAGRYHTGLKTLGEDILVFTFSGNLEKHIQCPIHNKKHKRSDKIYCVYRKNSLYLSVRCHSYNTYKSDFRIPLYNNRTDITGFTEGTLNLVKYNTTTIQKEYVGDLLVDDCRFNDKDVLFLRSPMGSGKTFAIKSLITRMEEECNARGEVFRLLVISTRRTCMMMLSRMFDVARYLDSSSGNVRGDLYLLDKIVVSMESLHRILPGGSDKKHPAIKKFDLVILDECESVMSNFSSRTMKDKRKNYKLLKSIISVPGTRALFSDAFLGESSMSYFIYSDLIKSKSWALIINTINQCKTMYELYTHPSTHAFMWHYKKAVQENKRFVFASDRISVIVYFKELIAEYLSGTEGASNKKVLTITSGSAPDVIMSASDCKSWEEYDYIFYSPAVTVGNSYSPVDPDKHFDCVFGVFTGTSSTLDAIQMTGRARVLKSQKCRILLTNTAKDEQQQLGDAILSRDEKMDIREYLTKRVECAQKELSDLLDGEKNSIFVASGLAQIPGAQVAGDIDPILVLPKDVDIDRMRISMPVPYLERVFSVNVLNERRSATDQITHWSNYLCTTFLNYTVFGKPIGQKKDPMSVMSMVNNRKKEYDRKRAENGDKYESGVVLSPEDIKKRRDEEGDSLGGSFSGLVTVDEVNIGKLYKALDKIMSPELEHAILEIRRTGRLSESIINWDRIHLFLSSHVNPDLLPRFYQFHRRIDMSMEKLHESELKGSVFQSPNEFYGMSSVVFGHIKPIYELIFKKALDAYHTTRRTKKTDWAGKPSWIQIDTKENEVYIDLVALLVLDPSEAYKLASNFMSDVHAITEESIYFSTRPLDAAVKSQFVKESIRNFFSCPTTRLSYTDAVKEFTAFNTKEGGGKKRNYTIDRLSIVVLGMILTSFTRGMFGDFFEKISWKTHGTLEFDASHKKQHKGVRSVLYRFKGNVWENSKSLTLCLYEGKMEFEPDYPFFDFIKT